MPELVSELFPESHKATSRGRKYLSGTHTTVVLPLESVPDNQTGLTRGNAVLAATPVALPRASRSLDHNVYEDVPNLCHAPILDFP